MSLAKARDAVRSRPIPSAPVRHRNAGLPRSCFTYDLSEPQPPDEVPRVTPRQTRHLAQVTARYPDAWRAVERYRQMRGQDVPAWPGWCYVPMAGAASIVRDGSDAPLSDEESSWVGIVAALAAWRATQGIYRWHPEILSAVWTTPLDGEIPVEVLYRLPEWCAYLETPSVGPAALQGAYVHLEGDGSTEDAQLRVLLDWEDEGVNFLHPLPIALRPGASLKDGLAEAASGRVQFGKSDRRLAPIRVANSSLRSCGARVQNATALS